LETDFVCDGWGRRWLPQWREEAERRASRRPRVRVADRQLRQWYRTLDQLAARKAEIEQALYLRLRDLFSLRVDLVFYDLTSTYFEGAGPPTLGAHGHSRDGKPRDPQVLVGVVMVEDWPIAHHVFRGNLRDATTVEPVLEDLERRFGVRRVVLVGDRGMVTGDNLTLLQGRGHGYLVGLNRRRNAAVARYLTRATGPWTECPGPPEPPAAPKTYVQEVPAEEPGVRVFVVRSEERLAYERTEREKAMARVRAELAALQRRVAQGKLKAPAKVGAAAARILGRHHGHRYYRWEYTDREFRFFEHPETLPREQALEGTYVLQTTEPNLTPVQAVTLYKRLSEVERAFCHLKDVIELRPIYHQTDPRVAAHIFVAALAFLLHRALEKKLKAAGLDLSATEALQALRTVRVVEIQLGDGRTKRSVTRGTARAARILAALGITELDPPTPPKEVSRTM
jgi:transposase